MHILLINRIQRRLKITCFIQSGKYWFRMKYGNEFIEVDSFISLKSFSLFQILYWDRAMKWGNTKKHFENGFCMGFIVFKLTIAVDVIASGSILYAIICPLLNSKAGAVLMNHWNSFQMKWHSMAPFEEKVCQSNGQQVCWVNGSRSDKASGKKKKNTVDISGSICMWYGTIARV